MKNYSLTFLKYSKVNIKSVSLLLLLNLSIIFAAAQSPFDRIKKLAEKALPDVNKMLQGKEPVTTSLDDAVTEAPELDNFVPKFILPANELPRSSDGNFYMFPGVWEFHLKSYCMKAGTYGPSKTSGDGYAYAPLKGPKADIIQSILKSSFKHPEVKQRDIQLLIWAIIGRSDLKDLPAQYMITATKLLDAKQLLRLNDGALKKITQSELLKLSSNLPEPARKILEAENNMRGMMANANSKYEELEGIAVLQGIMPENDGRKVKKGRWSLTPEGFYIRYFPTSYSKMTLQVYVKEGAYMATNYFILKNQHSKANILAQPIKIPHFKIKEFVPSSHAAIPSHGYQRLATSGDKNDNPDERNDALDKANKSLRAIGYAQTALGLSTNRLGTIVGRVNPLSPGAMFGRIMDFNLTSGRTISNSLNGDPPDVDYKDYAKAISFNYKKLNDIPFENEALNIKANDFAAAYLEAHSLMLALVSSNDKQGGAKIANDETWSNNQAQAIIYYKKRVGDALILAFDKWQKFLTLYEATIKLFPDVTKEDVEVYQNKLRKSGFGEMELKGFTFLRMNDAEIEKLKQQRIAASFNDYSGNFIDKIKIVMNAWNEYGKVYSSFPEIPAPW